ncbi:MAG TPA: S9 family peptidase [Steroidobacteraceae bacterium]|nr:S9 family peptidase [Steroidobacteraceae bacterium]
MKLNAAVMVVSVVIYAALAMPAHAADSERRLLSVADLNALRAVSDPAVSPDGNWVAYSVRTTDVEKDKRSWDLWMTSWDGRNTVQLTQSADSEHSPGWSPDGNYLSFLSNRGAKDGPDELWLLDRRGGDAQQITRFKGDVLDYDWSPDGKRLALVVLDDPLPGSDNEDQDKTAPPIVIDRYYFKEDETGYLSSRQVHLYVVDVATRHAEALTSGRFSETYPAWSPNGSQIAFMSKRGADPDRDNTFGMYVMEAVPGASARLLTSFVGEAGDSEWMSGPLWSPSGRDIAFVAASSDQKLVYYAGHRLLVMPAAGGTPRVISKALDRNVIGPQWSDDGKSIYGLVEDDRNQNLVRFDVASGRMQRLLEGRRETTAFELGPKGRVAVLDSTPGMPEEVFALESGKLRQLSRQNDEWLSHVELGVLDEISVNSADGTQISGFILKPPHYVAGTRYPTLLQIHGGPVSQYANSFDLTWQILAAQGYVIVATNPRGSSGRGEAFATGIYADWGNKDTQDVLAAVDYAVKQGIAEPTRLGVGGWSYGGILTDNVITRDKRFKAAVSGASIGNALAGYGTDMYTREYEGELGVPWKNLDVYIRNSYPFLHADQVVTPTLFMCGDHDFNVPLLNSEQMYQAVRSVGVETQLVIYPGQYHSFSTPSYLRDRLERWIAWYGKHLSVPPRPAKASRVAPAAIVSSQPPAS